MVYFAIVHRPDRTTLAGDGACSVISHTHAEARMAIFKKPDDNDMPATVSAPKVETPQPKRSNNVSVIGPTMVFKGELSADEDLIIEGLVEGSIAHHKKHLTVGAKGRVKADIHANSVIVLGQLVGDIHSEGMVSLAKGSDVMGSITCERIVMEDGARFRGNIEMADPSKVSAAPKKPSKAESVPPEEPPKLRGV